VLQPDAVDRAVRTVRAYAAFCRTSGVDEVIAVATSAIRDAENQVAVLDAFAAEGLPARVLTSAEEAYYGYLGIVNSTTLEDGLFLDVGGGSAQIGRVSRRALERTVSEPVGAVRMTEAFLSAPRAKHGEVKALRRHLAERLGEIAWLGRDGLPMVGTGGAVRTLAAMAQRASDYPLSEVHGYRLTRAALASLVEELVVRPVGQRARIPGLKQDRADIILAGAVVVEAVMDAAGADDLEVCGEGLREGLFYERFLGGEPALVPDVRRASVMNVARRYELDRPHADHVAGLALGLLDQTVRAGLQPSNPHDRELLWAAAMLHDVGVVVDYHDHHKHGFYLVLNAGLPGFDHRELALVALLVRGHRKAPPSPDWLRPLLADGDEERLWRLAACLRIAEQLERDRARIVRGVRLRLRGRAAVLELDADGDPAVARWSVIQEAPVFARAFGHPLRLA
jgi:exopolyphosphatase/guanosine-5'-triphosphate,3'-diphosphate pyrophosphatase